MSNITTLERRWCEENSITIDDYKKNYSQAQKEQIKNEMKAKAESEKELLKAQKESEKEAVKAEKIQAKLNERNAKIESYGDWATGFEFDEKGKIVNSTPNIIYLFNNHPNFKNRLLYDSYTKKYIYKKDNVETYFNDDFYTEIQEFKEQYIAGYKPNQTQDAIKHVAKKYSYNSATHILDNLKWDKKKRLETIFIDLLKVDDTPLNRRITKIWIMGAVKRLYEPGCPNENVLILTGGQGAGKSLTLKWLAGKLGFDAAINISANEQEYGMKLQNCWLCCFDELSGLSKKAAAEYKNWFSITQDSFRFPYGKTVEDNPRHNAYCATTNDATFLKDYSDNNERRMWVLECHATKEDGYENAVKRTDKLWRQIMAEAVYYYKADPEFIPYLGAEYIDELAEQQKKFKDFNTDGVGDMIAEILDRPYILKKNGDISSIDDLLRQIKLNYTCRCVEPDEKVDYINHISQTAIKRIMRDILGTSQSHKYMRAALDGKWCVCLNNHKINGKQGYWYVRGSWLNDKKEIIEKVVKKYDPTASVDKFMENTDEVADILSLK